VPLVDDAAPESTEQMAIVVRPGPNSQLQCNEARFARATSVSRRGVILDDDSQPSVAIGDAAVAEGDSGDADGLVPRHAITPAPPASRCAGRPPTAAPAPDDTMRRAVA
jgi:hypothetical protein